MATDTADIRSIVDGLNQRYAVHVDRRDWEAWLTCFTPDARLVLRGEEVSGHAAIQGRIEAETDSFARMRHLILPAHVADVDDGVARTVAYFLLQGRTVGGTDFSAAGVYDDRVHLGDERFLERRITFDYFAPDGAPRRWE